MFHCPNCKHAAHTRTSRYLSENTKERYHQCTNIHCSCTFVTMESVERILATPGAAASTAPHPNEKGKGPLWL